MKHPTTERVTTCTPGILLMFMGAKCAVRTPCTLYPSPERRPCERPPRDEKRLIDALLALGAAAEAFVGDGGGPPR